MLENNFQIIWPKALVTNGSLLDTIVHICSRFPIENEQKKVLRLAPALYLNFSIIINL